MKNTPVTIEERKRIQLDMLDEIDSFCRNHHIRYSLAFGTLLGAIRHRGYIPWDDDVDLIMPLPDMLRFKKEFKSDKLAYVDIDTAPHYEFYFSRICFLPTYNKTGLLEKSYGISVDLYPVVGMPDTEEEIQQFLKDIEPLYKKRKILKEIRRKLIYRLPFAIVPGFQSSTRRLRDIFFNSYPYDTARNFYHAGSLRRVNIFGFDVFDGFMDVEFEGHTYQSMTRYHEYLTHCFGDYMQYPPIEERHPCHVGNFYWKN